MHANNRWLKSVMKENELTRKTVSIWLYVNTSTVDRWLQPRMKDKEKNPSYRQMPDMAVALMKFRLGHRGNHI